MINEAFKYIDHGYAIFPVFSVNNGICRCGKYDCKSAGKHSKLGTGPSAATKNIKTIQNMQTLWQNANIGIATGKISGIVVLDIDPRDGGDGILKVIEAQYEKLPETVTTISGGNGLHYYFKYPEYDIPSRNQFKAGLDFKSDGDWIIAPPSRHIAGRTYRWKEGYSPIEIDLTPLPLWLGKLLISKAIN